MSDFQDYMRAQSESRAAWAQYDSASKALDLARINERLTEIKSQTEPLRFLSGCSMSGRNKLYSAAFYVVVGRMPNLEEEIE